MSGRSSLQTDFPAQVAQQALDAINALVLRDQEGVKPFVSNLARAVVSSAVGCDGAQLGGAAVLHTAAVRRSCTVLAW